ncbi:MULTISPECIES: YbaB/EbfC family nucleoid-associated protein [Megasphaera]|uniref:Nucleoid-associated protein HMPREF1250_1837 n=1 Tax=Megasphaera vaginalis (ex Srinivasan et al. 2021) TaxID=1111454 RepID=U7UJM9_9FIRM|nr:MULTISPECIES: YbaB/EbfC family nucleoid-associated protein [Megasphaera]ERT58643.1 DNA-binding protein, YbaB/EbfC family [Megasphaera vaginalis (ex Srinivasan et al. 2021)]
MFGGNNMQGMMKKVQKMQKDMQKLQDELKQRTVDATVGGGVLTLTMNGEKVVERVHIDPSVVDPEDTEMLEDLIVAAVNEANKKVDEMMAQEMSKITGGMKLPGMF